jgi:transcriptional repressor NrdR
LIVVSAVKTGANPDDSREIAKDIEGRVKPGMSTGEPRTMALAMIRAMNPAWEKNWLASDPAVRKLA